MIQLITLVMPYYNEENYISDALTSLFRQSDKRFNLVLVDNDSTDRSRDIVRSLCEHSNTIPVEHLFEKNPGKINALIKGLSGINTPYMATLDADTIYPEDYVRNCLALFEKNSAASCVIAIDLYAPAGSKKAKDQIRRKMLASRIFRRKCHAGAYAQAFRSEAYYVAGGYNPAIWPFVLEDHEIIYRIMKYGAAIYDPSHYCFASDRRTDRSSVNWTTFESIVYTFIPIILMDWFF